MKGFRTYHWLVIASLALVFGFQSFNVKAADYNISGSPLTVLSPNGGETLKIGSTYTISWRHASSLAGKSANISIILRSALPISPAYSAIIFELPPAIIPVALPSSDSVLWTVPSSIPAGSYIISVQESDPATGFFQYTDDSDAPFSIVADTSSSISFSRIPATSILSPFKAGDSTTATFQFSPWSYLQGHNWTLKSKTIYRINGGGGAVVNDADFIAGWNDIVSQNLCDSNGLCTITGTWQISQFQCDKNVNNVRKREEWVVANGVESNHNFFYFECSDSATSTSELNVNLSEFDDIFIAVTKNYFLVSDSTKKMTEAELRDLSTRRKSTSGSMINLSGTGTASGEKLIDIYNKAKGSQPTIDLQIAGTGARLSDNPSPVPAPTNLTISWSPTNSSQLSRCSGTGQGWDGPKSIGGGSSSGGKLNNIPAGTYTYSITCQKKRDGTISDTVTIKVLESIALPVEELIFDQAEKSETLAKLAVSVASQPEIVKAATKNLPGFYTTNPLPGLALDLAVSLDFAQKLVQASQGIKDEDVKVSTSVSPEVKLSGISKTKTQWSDQSKPTWTGISISTGWMSVAGVAWTAVKGTQITKTPPQPINYSNVTIAVAVRPDGKESRASISNAQGVLNLTLIINNDGSVFLKTTGQLNFQGTINADNTYLHNVVKYLANQRRFAPQAQFKTNPAKYQQIADLFYAAGISVAMTYVSLIEPSPAIVSMAKKYSMPVNQMNAQFNAALIGNLSLLTSIGINGRSITSMAANEFPGVKGILENLKALLPFAGAAVANNQSNNALAAGEKSAGEDELRKLIKFYEGIIVPKIQNNVEAMENLVKSQEFANLLNTAQAQECLAMIEKAYLSTADAGLPLNDFVDATLIKMSELSTTPEFRRLLDSVPMLEVMEIFVQNPITLPEKSAMDFFIKINEGAAISINEVNDLIMNRLVNHIYDTGTIDGGMDPDLRDSILEQADMSIWHLVSEYDDIYYYYEDDIEYYYEYYYEYYNGESPAELYEPVYEYYIYGYYTDYYEY